MLYFSDICTLKSPQGKYILSMRKVIGIGETVLDIIFKHEQPIGAYPGGSSFNAII